MSDIWLAEESVTWRSSDAPLNSDPASVDRSAVSAGLTFSGVRVLNSAMAVVDSPDHPDDNCELDVDEAGLALRVNSVVLWSARWSEIERCSTPERVTLRSGGRGVLLGATTQAGSSILAVLPVDRPRKMESSIRAFAKRHGVRGRRSAPAWPAVIVTVGAIAAVVTASLLAAGHSIHL